MHIFLGAYLLSGAPGYRQAGIHQYTRALIDQFARASAGAEDVRFTAFISPSARAELPMPDPAPPSPLSVCAASRSTESPYRRIWVEQVETPRRVQRLMQPAADELAIYHGLAFVAPLRVPCPTVITVHDLSFLTRPETHKPFNRLYLSLFTRWSCRHAARVIAVSEWTGRDVVALLGVDAGRVDVVPHGVHPRFRPLPPAEVAAFRREKSIGEQSVFFLGSLEPRKNLATLIEAFAAISSRLPAAAEAQLIIGGAPGWKYQPILDRVSALGLEGRVRFEGQIAHPDLPRWYNACGVFAYPSLYEGFGLPVLEAMACGAPVVASRVTSLPEVVGDAGILVDPRDAAGLADALARVLAGDALRQDLARRALAQAARFTWQRAAERTLSTYRQVTGRA